MKKLSAKLFTILFILAGAILLTVMVKMLNGTQQETAGAGPAWVERDIQALQGTLAVSANPTEEAFIQGKLQQLQQIQANSLQAQKNAPEKPADKCALRPTSLPTEAPASGVDQFPTELYEQYELFANSRWRGEVNGQWTAVLAGFTKDDENQGVLLVLVQDTAFRSVYPAPQPGGALHILSADGTTLTLIDDAGFTWYFDAAARVFVSSPDEILSTLAPQPTYTPTMDICGSN